MELGKMRKRAWRPKVWIIWQKATWFDIIGEFGLSSLCLQLGFSEDGGIAERVAKTASTVRQLCCRVQEHGRESLPS